MTTARGVPSIRVVGMCPSPVSLGGSGIANNFPEDDRYDHPVLEGTARPTSAAIPVLLRRGAALAGAAGALAMGPDPG
jgi:hypothetical protein